MKTIKYISLEVLTAELEKHVSLDAEPVNQAYEMAQMALETAHMATRRGVDTEYARSKVLTALEAL